MLLVAGSWLLVPVYPYQDEGEVGDLAGCNQGPDEEDDHGSEGDMLDDDSIFEEDPRQ